MLSKQAFLLELFCFGLLLSKLIIVAISIILITPKAHRSLHCSHYRARAPLMCEITALMCRETISCDPLQSPFSNGHVDLIGRVKAGKMCSERKWVNMRGRWRREDKEVETNCLGKWSQAVTAAFINCLLLDCNILIIVFFFISFSSKCKFSWVYLHMLIQDLYLSHTLLYRI